MFSKKACIQINRKTAKPHYQTLGELRAVSIILVVMNVYWYCYATVEGHGINIGVVDSILLNFNREAGLFHSVLYTKLFALLLLALSCLGTKGVINEKITWSRIRAVLGGKAARICPTTEIIGC